MTFNSIEDQPVYILLWRCIHLYTTFNSIEDQRARYCPPPQYTCASFQLYWRSTLTSPEAVPIRMIIFQLYWRSTMDLNEYEGVFDKERLSTLLKINDIQPEICENCGSANFQLYWRSTLGLLPWYIYFILIFFQLYWRSTWCRLHGLVYIFSPFNSIEDQLVSFAIFTSIWSDAAFNSIEDQLVLTLCMCSPLLINFQLYWRSTYE